ncbi:hypothetical protein L249_6422 [Ophiocordyceps polyrhachis-furcata BCC 54312]|uniref:MOZ protein represents a chromatin-associated acetyltransferase n=1 Tax=Ophiocordyceps polyrhachis-furcata BCC 54312 TaxID=1330021 RepID=A0A367LL85_9HYPO|nr:hypothetical protein L249_6422 [Ophiocordyceps polyrhachis-furcata BCC 54312]
MSTARLAVMRVARWRARAQDSRRAEASFAPRHGKAVEPSEKRKNGSEQEQQQQQQGQQQQQRHGGKKYEVNFTMNVDGGEEASASPPGPPAAAARPKTKGQLLPPAADDGSSSSPSSSSSLDIVVPRRARRQHHQMAPPPYVHHFDSYSLVKQLQGGGYTQQQATTAMKGIRTLLALNLDVAQESLVSKSDVENESYLFTAACSELSTEIKNNRRLQHEQTRQQRTLLQHEMDILTQSLNQELLTLNDNVRGMFNDRTMAVREEQKAVESAIQKINYKMSILLSSDSKSEIEGLRWVLIRRSVLGILFMAMLALAVLRYASYVGQQRRRQDEEVREAREKLRRDGGRSDHSAAADAAALLAAG